MTLPASRLASRKPCSRCVGVWWSPTQRTLMPSHIRQANEEDDVDGIMVYYPIYGGQQDQYIQQVVSPLKDVEGLHHQFLFNLYHK